MMKEHTRVTDPRDPAPATSSSVDEIVGKLVLTKDGRALGQIRGIDVDTERWVVRSLGVRLERDACEDFGVEPKLIGSYTIHILTEHVAAFADSVLLNKTLDELARAMRSAMGPRAGDAE